MNACENVCPGWSKSEFHGAASGGSRAYSEWEVATGFWAGSSVVVCGIAPSLRHVTVPPTRVVALAGANRSCAVILTGTAADGEAAATAAVGLADNGE